MRKITKLTAMGLLGVSLLGATAFAADAVKRPAEIYSGLQGITVEEAYEERGTDKTFGQLAEEAGKLDEFEAQMLENKKTIVEQRVVEGTLNREQADELLKTIANHECAGPGEQRLGREYGIGFGRGTNEEGMGHGNGEGLHLQDGSGLHKDIDHEGGYGRGFGRGHGRNVR